MLLNDVSIQKIPKFGQKFNKLKEMTAFLNDIDSVAAISKAFSENELQDKLGKDLGTWIYKASKVLMTLQSKQRVQISLFYCAYKRPSQVHYGKHVTNCHF